MVILYLLLIARCEAASHEPQRVNCNPVTPDNGADEAARLRPQAQADGPDSGEGWIEGVESHERSQ